MKTVAWLITGGTFKSTSGPEIDDYDIELETKECERLNISGNGHGERIPLVPACKWQAIETAPKNGEHIIAYGYIPESLGYTPKRHMTTISRWQPNGWASQASNPFGSRFIPTHWMPLPKSPHGV